jgi:hypothetical protein
VLVLDLFPPHFDFDFALLLLLVITRLLFSFLLFFIESLFANSIRVAKAFATLLFLRHEASIKL